MKTLINVKTDKEVKEKAQRVAKDLGVPLSTVINAYLKEFVRSKEVRFSMEPRLRPEVERQINKALKDFASRKNTSTIFSSAREAIQYLNRE